MAIIGHLDMDAFFASVEERDSPWLKGSPIAVGADPDGGKGRGVVSTANYLAREYGIRSALPISKAWRFSEEARKAGKPGVVFITPRFSKYSAASKDVTNVVLSLVPHIQKTSVDEMYLDLSFVDSYEQAKELAQEIKVAIKNKTALTGSIGIGPNKMIAKIASDFQKPDGLTVVTEAEVPDFIAPLPVRAIPGIGPKTEEKLLRLRLKTVVDVRALSEEELAKYLGNSLGRSLYEKVRGRASVELSERVANKSIGEHRTFSEDTHDMKFVLEQLRSMAESIISSMTKEGFRWFRTVVLTVRFDDFETKQRSVTTKESMHGTHELELKTMKLLLPFFEKTENPRKKPVRMVGLRVEKLM